MVLRKLFILPILFIVDSTCFSQVKIGPTQGNVSFVTSNNVYVKFQDTKNIAIGDTLFLLANNAMSHCLVVNNKSSMSCVATIVNGCEVKVGDQVIHKGSPKISGESLPANQNKVTEIKKEEPARSPKQNQKVRGSISAASYSSMSSVRDDTHRTMYRLSLNAPHINNSKFSFDTYINYRQTFISTDSGTHKGKDQFNIYDLAIRFDASPTMSFVLGRKINSKVTSIGAIDGLQSEKFFGKIYTGVVAGFRPDIMDYTFNTDLFQYGGYVGLKTENKVYSMTSAGFMEQRNSGAIDRRYVYFQHSSAIGEKLNLFSSFEFDLFNEVNGQSVRSPGFTNLFASAGYRISRNVDILVSYDSRKRILYYETLKTEIERILDDDVARQGIRVQLNVRPYKYVSAGGSYTKRFQQDDLNKSDNINGYFSLSKIPTIGGRLFINYNRNTSNYMRSNIFSFRHSRSLIKTKLDASVYYRMAYYIYLAQETRSEQNYYGADLSYNITRKFVFSILGEFSQTAYEDNYRINGRIMKRF